ncbi:MAG: phosphate ABC transporter, permease protein PstA [Phycisphaerales bacterium]|nr:phosphate ABC transporter, permease protein PstA [Phycisphaerales bacterium]
MSTPSLNEFVARGRLRGSAARVLSNRVFLWFCLAGTTLAVLVLFALLFSIFLDGWSALSWDFLTQFASRKPAASGIRGPLWGSVWVCAICALTALPLGIGTAIYLEEFAPKNRVTGFINLNIMNLAGVPSIVYGIIGLTAFARMFGGFGTAADPTVLLGYTYYNEYESVDGDIVRVRVEGIDRAGVVETTGVQACLARWNLWIAHPAPAGALQDGAQVEVLTVTDDGEESWRSATAHIQGDAEETARVGETKSISVSALAAATATTQVREGSWWSISLPFGSSVLAGGLTLMLVILPVVIISSQEALRAVPSSLRQGALALGSTRWQMVREMTLPAAIPGIMTGAILAMSRAIGEAAPLLVLGGFLLVFATPENLMSDFTVLPLQIYNWAGRPQASFHELAAAAIIVQLVVLLVFNGLAVLIRQKLQKNLQ